MVEVREGGSRVVGAIGSVKEGGGQGTGPALIRRADFVIASTASVNATVDQVNSNAG